MITPGILFVPGRNDYSDRDGTKYGIAIHNTSNDASAAGEASYATRRTDGVSAHFYVDDREVIQSIDTKYRTGHAGSTAGNENAVSVEITGTNSKSRAWWIANVAWDDLGRVLAQVCRHYGIEPRRASVAEMKANPKVRAFYSHDDMRRAWGATTHTDPGPNFPWDHLFAAVKKHMGGTPTEEDDMTPSERWVLHVMNYRLEALRANRAVIKVPPRPDIDGIEQAKTGFEEPNLLAVAVGADDIDEAQVAAELAPVLLAALTAEKIAAAIPANLAKQVADELSARLVD